jgi:branched-chain amino acid transport system substrate-binding protein
MTDLPKPPLNAATVLLLAALLEFLAVTPVAAFQDQGTVRIGLLESLTGTYAPYGFANLWGTQIAFDEINAGGGVTVGGKKVKIEIVPSPDGYDAGSDPAQSIVLLKKLVSSDQVLAIKGLSNSNAGLAVFNYLAELEKEGNPIVVHSSSVGTPEITKLSKYAFRNSFIESDVVVGLTREAQKRTGAKTAAFFTVKDNPYYAAIAEKVIMPTLKSLGIEVTAVTSAVTSDLDFTRQVNEIRAANADLVYVMAPTLSGINFLKEAKRRQLSPKLFIGNISLQTPEALASGGDAIEGLVLAAAYDPQSPKIATFAAEYKKRHAQDIGTFAVTGQEAGYLIAAAIEKSGIKNTPENLADDRKIFRDALAATAIDSPTGERVAFNADRETPKSGVYLVAKSGKFVLWSGAAQ